MGLHAGEKRPAGRGLSSLPSRPNMLTLPRPPNMYRPRPPFCSRGHAGPDQSVPGAFCFRATWSPHTNSPTCPCLTCSPRPPAALSPPTALFYNSATRSQIPLFTPPPPLFTPPPPPFTAQHARSRGRVRRRLIPPGHGRDAPLPPGRLRRDGSRGEYSKGLDAWGWGGGRGGR
jgi:hypothetical protein